MGDMGALPMPGGWTLSRVWLPLCGESWAGTAACFLGMWTAMMAAMMLPSLLPMLWRWRRAPAAAALAAAGYLFVWSALGAIVYVPGAALAQAALLWPALARAVPFATAVVVLLAGAFQFSAWKARHLAWCREAAPPVPGFGAWRHGLRLGLHCCRACAGLVGALLALGMMDWRAMVLVTAAVTAERLAPDGKRVARVVGGVALAAGYAMAWPTA